MNAVVFGPNIHTCQYNAKLTTELGTVVSTWVVPVQTSEAGWFHVKDEGKQWIKHRHENAQRQSIRYNIS